jgi:hypothetical protein
LKNKLINIVLFIGILLASKASIMTFQSQEFSIKELLITNEISDSYNIIYQGSINEEPNILNLPGQKVEQVQFKADNNQQPIFTICKNSERYFKRKYSLLSDKIDLYVQRNLQKSFYKLGVLLL